METRFEILQLLEYVSAWLGGDRWKLFDCIYVHPIWIWLLEGEIIFGMEEFFPPGAFGVI